MLHSSNNLRHRISMEMFHNKTIMECFEPSEQFKLSHNGIKLLNFTLFPFLLDIDYKNVTTIIMLETAPNRNKILTPDQHAKRTTGNAQRHSALTPS